MLDSKVVQEENERQGVPAPATSRSTSASIPLMKVLNWDGKSEDITQQLAAAFQAKDYLDCIKNLKTQNVDPPSYINNLDKVLSFSVPNRDTWTQISVTVHRYPRDGFRTAKTVHTSVEWGMRLIWNPSNFPHICRSAQ